jgi:UDP-GlcNAc:undecaprenyl-phosphate GlcNAc-1-phosphate transferase
MTTLLSLIIILNVLFYLNLNKFSKIINIFDKPDNKLKKHKTKVPLLGGVIVITNLFFIFFCNYLLNLNLFELEISLREFFSILFFLVSFFILGLFDDKYKINPEKKIILSILFSVITLFLNDNLILSSIKLSFYDQQIILHSFGIIFTIFCIIIFINALNFYDGINGQSLIFLITCFIFLAHRSPIFIFYLLIVFILIIILLFNLHEKIFMGDNGIYLIGSILIIALIYEYNKFSTIEFADEIFFLLIIPGYDLVRLTLVRIYNGKNAFYGDRNHLHHMLMRKYSLIKTNLILIFLNLISIILYSIFKISFFIVFVFITAIYFLVILKLKKT